MTTGFPPPPWLVALQQSLLATGGNYTWLSQAGLPSFDPAALAASYQRHFMPAPPPPNAGANSAGALRWQRATQTLVQLGTGVAADAAGRFQAALASTDPTLPKITSLRALHELWIDCGEAAYAVAAHSHAWAQAQAELLNALVDLHAEASGAAR